MMSDRAKDKLRWHRLLLDYKKEILPEAEKELAEMDEPQRKRREQITNYHCGLHSYVQAAKLADKVLQQLK